MDDPLAYPYIEHIIIDTAGTVRVAFDVGRTKENQVKVTAIRQLQPASLAKAHNGDSLNDWISVFIAGRAMALFQVVPGHIQ